MAALTPTAVSRVVSGNKRIVDAMLPAINNGDTWNTGLNSIDSAVPGLNDTANAADRMGFTISGGTLTFSVVGTARAHHFTVRGN